MITAQEMRLRLPGDVGFPARRGRGWVYRARPRAAARPPVRLPRDQVARLLELRAGGRA